MSSCMNAQLRFSFLEDVNCTKLHIYGFGDRSSKLITTDPAFRILKKLGSEPAVTFSCSHTSTAEHQHFLHLAAIVSTMRLLNTITRELEEFYHDIPEYAILSHTWDEKELLFDDLKHSNPKGLPGFEKVDRCCKLAAGRGFEYVWIDTCCIDKNSSAELQEAINSMYRWYKNAEVCFAYLSDVPSGTNPARTGFATSLWFTRGWTLQELIAPRIVEFYGRNEDGEWGEIGTKSSLRDVVAEITGVPIAVLKTGSLANLSVATRMSWASRRQTKREEDRAYSLMGIFDVHMTMVYGEGKRAFGRLQEEIMKVSNDHSLFAWSSPKRHIRHWTGQGLLADSPADFFHSGQYHCSEHSEGAAAYQITNVGLRVQFPLLPRSECQSDLVFDEEDDIEEGTVPLEFTEYFAILNCCRSFNGLKRLGIILRLTEDENGEERGVRCHTRGVIDISPEDFAKATKKVVYITRNRADVLGQQQSPYIDCHISLSIISAAENNIIDAWPAPEVDGAMKAKGRASKAVLAAIIIKKPSGLDEKDFAVVMGLYDGEAWCDVVPDVGSRSAKKIWKSHKYDDQKDRKTSSLQGTRSVSVAVRRRGTRLPKIETDIAYTLSATISEGER